MGCMNNLRIYRCNIIYYIWSAYYIKLRLSRNVMLSATAAAAIAAARKMHSTNIIIAVCVMEAEFYLSVTAPDSICVYTIRQCSDIYFIFKLRKIEHLLLIWVRINAWSQNKNNQIVPNIPFDWAALRGCKSSDDRLTMNSCLLCVFRSPLLFDINKRSISEFWDV